MGAPRRAGDPAEWTRRSPSTRRRRARRNSESLIKADRPELSLIEFEIKPGGGVQPHFHKGHSDSFFVLEGEVEFHVADSVVQGLRDVCPRASGVVHFFRNVSSERARALNLHTPGGFATYRRELRSPREARSRTSSSSSATTSSTSELSYTRDRSGARRDGAGRARASSTEQSDRRRLLQRGRNANPRPEAGCTGRGPVRPRAPAAKGGRRGTMGSVLLRRSG